MSIVGGPGAGDVNFNKRPFVAGSLTGIRAFRVDADGRLTGVIHKVRFEAELNTATCLIPPFMQMMRTIAQATANSKLPRPEHHVAGVGCSCGFYAYFRGRNSYIGNAQVAGIIQGYGVCTVGNRGFRAEKARLVALVAPSRWGHRLPGVRRGYRFYLRWTRNHVRPLFHTLAHQAASLLSRHRRTAAAGMWLGARCDKVTTTAMSLTGLTVMFWVLLHGMHHSWSLPVFAAGWAVEWAATHKPRENTPPLSLAEFEVVARNYPGVPVYRSRRAAAKAHPLTLPERSA